MRNKFLTSLGKIALYGALICTTSLSIAKNPKNLAQETDPATRIPAQKKAWNWMVYMCNNNNLHRYGIQNFKEMVQAGSTPSVNVLLQMDDIGATAIKRFYIEQNNPIIMEAQSNTPTSFSGTPQNLFEFAQWGIKQYPSERTCLVLWNHGSGIKDPSIWDRMIMRWRDDLFVFNHRTGLLELNRAFRKNKDVSRTLKSLKRERGIAFNDAAETYLNNDDLKKSLSKISTELLNGKKLDLLAMDACHMAMVEIASEVKDSVKIIAASEEVEPGAGYDYGLLKAFATKSFDERTLAQHIVTSYKNRYMDTLGDYTQSAIDLTYINELELVVRTLASSLTRLLSQGGPATIRIVRQIRFNYNLSTEFLDTDYIDLNHLFKSLALIGSAYAYNDEKWQQAFADEKPEIRVLWDTIACAAALGIEILQKMILSNAAGVNLPEASGLAIYFPTSSVHASYYKTDFAKTTGWAQFLEKFIRSRKDRADYVEEKRHISGDASSELSGQACCQECAKGKTCASEKEKKHKDKKKKTCLPCNKRRQAAQKVVDSVFVRKAKGSMHNNKNKTINREEKPCCDECAKHAKNAKSSVTRQCPCANRPKPAPQASKPEDKKKKSSKKRCPESKNEKSKDSKPCCDECAKHAKNAKSSVTRICPCANRPKPAPQASKPEDKKKKSSKKRCPESKNEKSKDSKPCCDECAKHAKNAKSSVTRICPCANRPKPAPQPTKPEHKKKKDRKQARA